MVIFAIFVIGLLIASLIGKIRERNTQAAESYMPLETGNVWYYEKVTYNKTAAEEMPAFLGETINNERYEVGAPKIMDGRTFWDITVMGKCARDGRYRNTKKSICKSVMWAKGTMAIKGRPGVPAEIVEEIIDRGTDVNDTSSPCLKKHGMVIFMASNPIIPELAATMSLNGPELPASVGIKRINATVTVPAGTFKHCIAVETEMPPLDSNMAHDNESSKDTDWPDYNKGWKTVSWFAPGVGMVKEIQYECEGKEIYIMELQSYRIVGGTSFNGNWNDEGDRV